MTYFHLHHSQSIILYFCKKGYDSDVEREKNMDYGSKIYVNPIREKEGVKPHLQESVELDKLVYFEILDLFINVCRKLTITLL